MTKTRVLFLCTGNSCRSQMAEGWLRHLAGDRFEAFSAGIEAHGQNPRAIAVMRETGVDISGQESEVLNPELLKTINLLVTVCSHADAHCPVVHIPGKREHWPFPDPAKASGSEEDIMAEFRRVRDKIRTRVEAFIAGEETGQDTPMNASEAIFNRIASCKTREIRKGEHLFHQGDAVRNIYVLRRGSIKLIRCAIDGNPVILHLATDGEMLAEASLFSGTYHCAAVVDSPSAELACFDRHELMKALETSPATAMEVMALCARRIHTLRAILEIRNIRSAKQRIYNYLQLESDDGHRVLLGMSYKDMAYQLGLAHETLYRELKHLEEEGRIERKERFILLR